MTELTNYTESQVLTHLLGDTAWTKPSIWLAAFEVMPDDAGDSGTEATYSGYARVSLTQTNANWNITTITDGQRIDNVNIESLVTPTATDGADLVGIGIYDAASGGNLLCVADLDVAITPTIGVAIDWAAGAMDFEFTDSNSRVCDPLFVALANHIFRTDTWAQYTAITHDLCTTVPVQAGTGEVVYSGNGYAQVALGPDSAKWTFPSGGSGIATNAVPAVFGGATADWTGINGQIINGDSDTLFYHTFSDAPRTYSGGSTVTVPTGDLTVTLA